jgi:hypothetical protein
VPMIALWTLVVVSDNARKIPMILGCESLGTSVDRGAPRLGSEFQFCLCETVGEGGTRSQRAVRNCVDEV